MRGICSCSGGGPDFIRDDRYEALPDGGLYDIDSVALRTQAGITGFARGSWDWEGEYLEVYQVPPPPSPGIVIEHDCGCTSGGGSGAAGWSRTQLRRQQRLCHARLLRARLAEETRLRLG